MARFNPLRAREKQNRKQRPGSSSGCMAVRSFRMRRTPDRIQRPSHPESSVPAREMSNGKRCLGRPGSTDAYSPSIPGYMTGCSFHIFAACHSWRGTKKTYVRQQARPGTSSKETPTARERKARQTVRWLTPYRSASEPDNFSRYISYL